MPLRRLGPSWSGVSNLITRTGQGIWCYSETSGQSYQIPYGPRVHHHFCRRRPVASRTNPERHGKGLVPEQGGGGSGYGGGSGRSSKSTPGPCPVATLHRRQASATVGEGETENCIQLLGWVESSVKVAPRVDDKEVL